MDILKLKQSFVSPNLTLVIHTGDSFEDMEVVAVAADKSVLEGRLQSFAEQDQLGVGVGHFAQRGRDRVWAGVAN